MNKGGKTDYKKIKRASETCENIIKDLLFILSESQE